MILDRKLDRRSFSLALLAAGIAVGVSACGRRGALEPPPYTEQGREFQRRQGRNPDGSRRESGQGQANSRNAQREPEGSVREGLQRDADARTTVDVESDLERNRVEGIARDPSDPGQTPGAAATPALSPTGGGTRRRPPGIIPPKQSFILDPLL